MTPAGIAEVLREAADLLTDISDLSKDCTTAMMEAAGRYAHNHRAAAAQLETMEPAAFVIGDESRGPMGHFATISVSYPATIGLGSKLYAFPDEKGDRKDGDET